MVSLTAAFEYISLSFQNILNCCSPFDSNNLVSAMIRGSNRTNVSSILVNSPSSKGLLVKLLCSFAASSKKCYWNDNVSCKISQKYIKLKSIVGTKFRRSHVCLHSQAGKRLRQLMVLLFFVML